MTPLDAAVVAAYLLGVVALGVRLSRGQTTTRHYFLTRDGVPTWVVFGSIVATETSTVTLISVPGYAFTGDLTFLQLAVGYVFGKAWVAYVLMPGFFGRGTPSAYRRLGDRFGPATGRLSAAVFLTTRCLSDGFRLFATGLVLAAVLATVPGARALAAGGLPGLDPATGLLVLAVLGLGAITLAYTLLGGMTAVVWTDVLQLAVYTGGACVTGVVLLGEIPGGWQEVVTRAGDADKLRLINLDPDPRQSYTLWSGLIGGMFLAAGTHGADQMFVQRYLCARSPTAAGRALVGSGLFVAAQFALFLGLGLMLWVYYTAHAPRELAALTLDGQLQADRILPTFIVAHLPSGVRGLMLAAIVAAAMSTLSSSLNSAAASTVTDFYQPLRRGDGSDRHDLWISRWATAGWAVLQVAVALSAIVISQRVVDEVLGIQSFSLGLLLGLFALSLTVRAGARGAAEGLAAGLAVLLAVRLGTDVSWQWYVLLGSVTTGGVGWWRSPARRAGATS